MIVYTAELRKHIGSYIVVDCSDCYMTTIIEKMEHWLKQNTYFDNRDHFWWWVILKCDVNNENGDGSGIYSVYDWDGNELDNQPTDSYLANLKITKKDFRKLYSNKHDGIKIFNALQEIKNESTESMQVILMPDMVLRWVNILYRHGFILSKEPDINKYIRKKKIISIL